MNFWKGYSCFSFRYTPIIICVHNLNFCGDAIEINNTGATDLVTYFSDDVTDATDLTTAQVVVAGVVKTAVADALGWAAQKQNLLIFNKHLTIAGKFELKVTL